MLRRDSNKENFSLITKIYNIIVVWIRYKRTAHHLDLFLSDPMGILLSKLHYRSYFSRDVYREMLDDCEMI